MNTLNIILLIITAASALSAILIIRLNRIKTEETLKNMERMIDTAVKGNFNESIFDESLVSKVESKLINYLSASKVSEKNLAFEKEKIKGLISDISHQTKTPIANILLYAELLAEGELPESSKSFVTALNEQAGKLSFLVESLVKTSRLEAGILAIFPKPNKIQPMLDNIFLQIEPKALAKEITLDMLKTDETAYFDSKWTEEAIYNIIDNAVKYTAKGGVIKVKTTPYDLFCRIDIIDTGIGITEEEKPKVFSRFYRSPRVSETEGVGIGLYLTRKILSDEGGYVKLKPNQGKGTTFSVFLSKKG